MTPRHVVERMYAAFASRHRAELLEVLAPDIRWVQNAGLPGGGETRGASAVIEHLFTQYGDQWTGFGSRKVDWIASGPVVVVLGTYTGVYAPTGRSLDAAFAHVYEVAEGRITRFRQYTDTAIFRWCMGLTGDLPRV